MSNEFLESWVFRLLKNLLGYAAVAVPGALLVYYYRKINFLNKPDSCFYKYIKLFVHGEDDSKLPDVIGSFHPAKSQPSVFESAIAILFCFIEKLRPKSPAFQKALKILFCFAGLQVSYLIWGYLQEKIMTQDYHNERGEVAKFKDSQFLVFVNRVLAFVFAGTYVSQSKQPRHTAPLYKYSYCSFSNIMSSWFQYEALKYVKFPTQVLVKASKIIPVMIMGWVISHKCYKKHEIATAIAISIGAAIFLLSGKSLDDIVTAPTASGAAILTAYIVSDSFTSNWQSQLFKQYHMSSMQMMCGVNFFSCILTSISLLQPEGFGVSFMFLMTFSNFWWDCLWLSVCSAVGQLFIFYTISEFGAVVFVIMMTIRQVLAILLSCLAYNHPLSLAQVFGVFIVFSTVFLRIYLNHRIKHVPQKLIEKENAPNV